MRLSGSCNLYYRKYSLSEYRKATDGKFHGITFSIPIMHCAYVGLMALAIVISKAWNKIDMQRSFVVYGISHLSLAFSLCIHSPRGEYSMVHHSKVLYN